MLLQFYRYYNEQCNVYYLRLGLAFISFFTLFALPCYFLQLFCCRNGWWTRNCVLKLRKCVETHYLCYHYLSTTDNKKYKKKSRAVAMIQLPSQSRGAPKYVIKKSYRNYFLVFYDGRHVLCLFLYYNA